MDQEKIAALVKVIEEELRTQRMDMWRCLHIGRLDVEGDMEIDGDVSLTGLAKSILRAQGEG